MDYKEGHFGRVYNLELNCNDDLLPEIREIANKEKLEYFVIMAGIGGFSNYVVDLPTKDKNVQNNISLLNTNAQLSAIQGVVNCGDCYISSIASVEGEEVLTRGGRMKDKSTQKFYCQCTLAEILF